MKWRARIGAVVLTVLSTNPASLWAAPLPGFVLRSETARVSTYAREGQRVEAQKIERYLVRMEELLGQRVPEHVRYYRYELPQEIAAATGRFADGVAYTAACEIHSVSAFHPHEIVHIVAGQLGDPGNFFQEGLAVTLGDGGRWRGRDVDGVARRSPEVGHVSRLLSWDGWLTSDDGYFLAGSFVGYLVRTQGLPKVVAFFRATPRADTPLAFRKTFGMSLDEAGAQWASAIGASS